MAGQELKRAVGISTCILVVAVSSAVEQHCYDTAKTLPEVHSHAAPLKNTQLITMQAHHQEIIVYKNQPHNNPLQQQDGWLLVSLGASTMAWGFSNMGQTEGVKK